MALKARHVATDVHGQASKAEDESVTMDEVERAAHQLEEAVEHLIRALDAAGDDRLACQYVPIRVALALEQLSMRLSYSQMLE